MESLQSSTWTEPAREERFVRRDARFWPLAFVFAAFSTLPAACHWPYPDPRDPIAQSDGRDSKSEPRAHAEDARTPTAANANANDANEPPQ